MIRSSSTAKQQGVSYGFFKLTQDHPYLGHYNVCRRLSVVFVCAPPTDTSSSFLAVDSAPTVVELFGLLVRRSGISLPDELRDLARSFDSFR